MSDAFEPTSQHFAEVAGLVVCGKFMMKPYLSATASIADMPVKRAIEQAADVLGAESDPRRARHPPRVSSAPATISAAPPATRHEMLSPSTSAASKIVKPRLALSIGATREAGAICSARK